MRISILGCFFLLCCSVSFATENVNFKGKNKSSLDKNSMMSTVSIDNMFVNEYDGTIVVPISLDAPDTVDTVIHITTMDGTATSPNDYTAVTTTVTIPAGQTSVSVLVYIVADGVSEVSLETFTVNGTVITGNTTNTTVSGTINIVDVDDSTISIGNVTISEYDGVASVPVSVSTSAFDTVIQITTVDNSAINPNDYTTTSVTGTIPALQNTIYVSIPILDDNIGEPTENFNVIVSVTSGNTLNTSDSGTITIIDDDTPEMTISNATVNEDAGTASVAISITNPSAFDTVITIDLVADTATNQNDYVSTTAMVVIPAGQTSVNVSISIVDDLEDEPNENFTVYGEVQSGNTSNISANGTVTIIDNDVCTSNPIIDCDGDGVTNEDEQNPPNGGMPTNPENPCDFNAVDVTLAVSGDYLIADCDTDGTLNDIDCDPFNDAITIGRGDACDDGNPLTLSDFIDENCNCIGFDTEDADGDGILNIQEVLNGTNYNDACDPMQNIGYTGYDADNSTWQAANCDNDDINNALEIILGSDPYDINYNTITGILTFDSNSDGCNGGDDLVFPYTRLHINDGVHTTTIFTNDLGEYSFMATTGNYTITPDLENPTYFTVAPINATANFSTVNNNNFHQDFCITTSGPNLDVEVVIAPIAFARPGFDAEYVLTYRNKGNQTISGTVNFTFDDTVLDYISSTQTLNSQSAGILSWNYIDLAPFESRSINITLNVNGPTETPPVNNGDELTYSAAITPVMGDISPSDNQFEYEQIVVGSYDPNDITCMEGNTVNPDEIGKDLHYIINFENTGTFFAENIVVEMNIDPAEFDINTLQLMSSSHNASVTINGTLVRFIFQNIFLPVDGQGNLLIKMKSQNTLVENDVVSNRASIFFDYNFPIITNNEETTYAVLSNPTVEINNSITLYPNPTKNNIQITSNHTIKTITLYDVQGRKLIQEAYSSNEINFDISNQASGVYFVQISTEKGVNTEKIIKL